MNYTPPEFDDYIPNGWGQVLKCPHCGDTYTHQRCVEVYEREEDAKHGLYVNVHFGTGAAITNNSMARNPSRRRQGIRILFDCEGCEESFAMTVVQHKGQTLVDIEYE